MGYERRPFQPETPYPNQVATELNKANDNFDLLARAFVGDDPTTLKVKNALNSDNAINSTNALNSENAINSDTVDGFHASQTPTANTIPVALNTGKLDIGWLPDNIGGYGYRRIDLTNATSDYNLQLGEEAYYVWDTSANLNQPLRIQVSGSLYWLCVMPVISSGYASISLNPNNTTYSSAFSETRIYSDSSLGAVAFSNNTRNAIFMYSSKANSMLLQTTTQSKMAYGFYLYYNDIYLNYTTWNNTTTVWSSLGTLTVGSNVGTIYVLVRRIL